MTREELQASIDARNAERDRETSASWRGKVALAEADARPGRYYVTARDGRRTSFLLGPFVQPTLGKSAHAPPVIVDTDGDLWEIDAPTGAVGPMMGGCYVAAPGSDFREAVEKLVGANFYGAVALHDRFETTKEYDALSA